MLKINLFNQAKKFLARLTSKHKRQMVEKIQSLRGNLTPDDGKSMNVFDGKLLVDSGEYRSISGIDTGSELLAILSKREFGKPITRDMK